MCPHASSVASPTHVWQLWQRSEPSSGQSVLLATEHAGIAQHPLPSCVKPKSQNQILKNNLRNSASTPGPNHSSHRSRLSMCAQSSKRSLGDGEFPACVKGSKGWITTIDSIETLKILKYNQMAAMWKHEKILILWPATWAAGAGGGGHMPICCHLLKGTACNLAGGGPGGSGGFTTLGWRGIALALIEGIRGTGCKIFGVIWAKTPQVSAVQKANVCSLGMQTSRFELKDPSGLNSPHHASIAPPAAYLCATCTCVFARFEKCKLFVKTLWTCHDVILFQSKIKFKTSYIWSWTAFKKT